MARLLRGALLAACLVCAAVPGAAQSGTGHFRYGALSWERNGVDSREVTFTLSSSWRRSYEGFAVPVTDTSLPVTLSGYVTPKLTVGEGSTEHINLPLRIEQFDKSGSTYEQGGDWITGYTIIRHTYSSDGPFAVTFAGCCVAGSYDKEHFSITAMVALSTSDFSPALAIIPVVNAEPGHSFAVPAIHPQGLIGPMLRDGSMAFFNFALPAGQPAGISMDAATGVVSVGASVAVGQHLLAVQVGLNHSMAKSGAQFLVNVRAPGGTTAYLSPAVPSEDDSRGSGGDVVYSVRTGFAISVFIDIISPTAGATYQVSTAGTNLTLFGMRADVVYGAPGRAAAAFQLRWDKPCVGDAMHVAICFSAMQFVGGAPTGDRTAPGCIEVFILEDEAPVFLAPMQGDVFTWMMGREYSFDISVRDPAVADTVSALGLLGNITMPAGAMLAKATLSGNEGSTRVTWMPPPWSGGGTYQLCFAARDTAGSTYEQCRLGIRSTTVCVSVVVPRCKYVVRARESLSDVAAAFNSDWVQLWALNPDITQPDLEIGYRPAGVIAADPSKERGAIIRSGHLYRVDGGEYAAAIAYKFGITAKQLLFLNADVARGGEMAPLEVGKMLCVIPNSCLRD